MKIVVAGSTQFQGSDSIKEEFTRACEELGTELSKKKPFNIDID